jgi:hypothetical protein
MEKLRVFFDRRQFAAAFDAAAHEEVSARSRPDVAASPNDAGSATAVSRAIEAACVKLSPKTAKRAG